MTKNCGNL